MSSENTKRRGQSISPIRFNGQELVCRYHETTHEPVSVDAICWGYWRAVERKRKRKFKIQTHLEPYASKNSFGELSSWINLHTYDEDGLALFDAYGFDSNGEQRNVELWLTPEDIVAIRDGLGQLLEDEDSGKQT